MLLGNVKTAEVGMLRLKALGVRLALDDFGTGHSSCAVCCSTSFVFSEGGGHRRDRARGGKAAGVHFMQGRFGKPVSTAEITAHLQSKVAFKPADALTAWAS